MVMVRIPLCPPCHSWRRAIHPRRVLGCELGADTSRLLPMLQNSKTVVITGEQVTEVTYYGWPGSLLSKTSR